MSALAEAAVCEEQVQLRRERRPCSGADGGVTLEQLLARAREATQVGASADCPVCGGSMHAHGLEGRCGACGSRLS